MKINQINLPLAVSKSIQQYQNATRSKRELTIEERKSYCKGIEYGGIVVETFGDIAGDIGGMKDDFVKLKNNAKSIAGVGLASHIAKGGLDIASAALECDDVPFDEIKEILDDRFNEIDRKLDANTEAMKKVSDMVTNTFNSVERMRRDMKGGFNEVLEKIESQEIKTILNSIDTIIQHFENEKKEMKDLPKDQYVNKLEKQNGVLDYLRNIRLPKNDSLHSLLFKLIDKNNNFAIPKRSDDTIAFQALYALFYGTQTYASIMFFLLKQHAYLADYYYQNRELKNFNDEFTTVKNIFDEFKSSLIGEDEGKSLFKEVSDIFAAIKKKSFISEVEDDLFQDLTKKENYLLNTKKKIEDMKLDIILEIPLKADNVDFVDPVLKTPYGEWIKDSTVKYAIQFVENGKYSKIGPWSKAFSVQDQANPTLTFSVDEKKRDRLIFREIDDDTPELVGILKYPEVEFKDVNRDLFDACGSIHKKTALREVRKLVSIKADINVVFDLERNALHAAAESGNIEVARYLIKKGLKVNVKDMKDFTPLHVAAGANRDNTIEFLVQKGADVNAHTNTDKTTPLHIASRKGFLKSVTVLISNEDLNPNEKEISGYTALHEAVFSGSHIVEALTTNDKIDVNAKSTIGLTPFHLAVINGDRAVADALLKTGKVRVNEGNNNGLTALHFVSMAENLEMIEFLLNLEGININAPAIDINWTPLHFAIYSKQQKAALKLLENGNIDINILAKGEVTPLHLSVATGQLSITKELLNKNSNIEAKTEEGYTPLHLAAMHLDPDTALLLLGRGANIEAKSNDGSTALHLAIKSGRLETAIKLLDNKANIDAQMSDGSTPLHLAVSLKLNNLVSKLLSSGADVYIKDAKNFMPIFTAIQNKDLDIIRIFVQTFKETHFYDEENVKNLSEVSQFMTKVFIQDLYDLLKNIDSEKYKDYKELSGLEAYKKLGLYEMLKVITNDPRSEENFMGEVNSLEYTLNFARLKAEECLVAEKKNIPRDEFCPESSRMSRRHERSITAKNKYSPDLNFLQVTPSVAISGNKFSSPFLSVRHDGSFFSLPQYNSFQNYDGLGSLLLLDILIRKLNDKKYFKKTNEMHSDLELQAKALSIAENIEKLLEFENNNTPADELVDLAEVHSKVFKALKSGNENNIPKLLCPMLKNFVTSNSFEAEDDSHENLMILIKQFCMNAV